MATIVLSHVPNPLEFGVVITDDSGAIRRFLEKPSWGEVFSDTVNTGMYILEPEIFQYMEHAKSYDWSQDIFPQMLTENKPLFGYIMDGDYWCDVGNLNQYREAQYTVMDGQTRVRLAPSAEALSHGVWVGDGCDIDPTAQLIAPVVIGRNCKLKPKRLSARTPCWATTRLSKRKPASTAAFCGTMCTSAWKRACPPARFVRTPPLNRTASCRRAR